MGRNEEMVRDEIGDRVSRAWSDLLGTEAGRMVFALILDRCGVDRPSMSGDDRLTAYQEGRRSVGLELMAEFLVPLGASVRCDMLLEAEAVAQSIEHARLIDEQNRMDSDYG